MRIIKNIINHFLLERKIYIFISFLILISTFCFLFILFFTNININKSTIARNSKDNKTEIKNKFLKKNPQAEINSVFICRLPDKTTKIFIGGWNIKALFVP